MAAPGCRGRPIGRRRDPRTRLEVVVRCRTSSCSQATTLLSVTSTPSSKSRRLQKAYLQTQLALCIRQMAATLTESLLAASYTS
jgi:hypothetical protein